MRKLIAVGILLATGCGSAPEAPVVVAETTVLTGVASKGPLQGAAVEFFEVNADGSAGAAFTATTPFPVETDAAGGFSVAGLPNDRPMLVRASGGSFVDESDPTPDPGRRVIAFAPGEFLEAVVPAGASTIAITPYSMAVLEKARAQAGTSNFVAVYAAVHALAQQAFGFDPVLTAPADPVDPSPTAPLAAKQYALLLGAAAQAINGIAVANGGAPTHAEVMAFVTDFADGRLDVTSLAEEIARFRNNNYDRYADTALPAVDENLLSTDPDIPDQPPTIGAIADQVIAEDSATAPLAFTVDDAETPAADLTVTASSADTVLVPNANVVPGGSGASRTVTVTPAANRSGAANITVTVTDGAGNTASETFQLTVTAVNDVPVANDDSISLAEGGSAAALVGGATSVAANDSDLDTDPLSVALVSGPASAAVFLLNADGSFSYLHDGSETTNDAFTYKVNDGSADSNVATVSIAIAAVNDAPTLDAIADPSAILEDAGLQTLGLAGIGAGPGESQNLTVTATSSNVALIPNPAVSYTSPNATGSLAYTPAANQSGSVTITVTVMDDGGTTNGGVNTVTRAFTVAVTAVNDAPVAQDDAYAGVIGSTISATAGTGVLANDSDVDHSTGQLSASTTSPPAHGALTLNADGSFSYVHNGSMNLADSFSYEVCDPAPACATATVTLTLTTPPPWLISQHSGSFDVITQTTRALVSWPAAVGPSYDICVTYQPETTSPEDCMATGGAQLIAGLNSATAQPYTISGLTPGAPVYLGLLEDGVLKAWTAATPTAYGTYSTASADLVYAQAFGVDGTRYVGGEFSTLAPVTGGGVTLAPSGALGHALAYPDVVGRVYAVAPDGDGGFYLGGLFTAVGGQARRNLAHLDRLGRVTSWNPGAAGGTSGTVWALTVHAGVIYAGGTFATVGGGAGTQAARAKLAAFDASGAVLPWNPGIASGTNVQVSALAADAGVIYAGGNFNFAGGGTGTTERNFVAAFDTSGALTGWNPGANSTIATLVVDAGVIYAGGTFSMVGGGTGTIARSRLAAFDASGNVTAWDPGANAGVSGLATMSGVIYAAGGFTQAGSGTTGGGVVTRNRIAAFSSGGAVTSWNPGIELGGSTGAGVFAIAAGAGAIYVAGYYSGAGGGTGTTPRANLAAFDASGTLTSWNPGTNYMVRAIAVSGGIVYAGGEFTIGAASITKATRRFLAAFDPDGNLTAWNPGAAGGFGSAVNALAVDATTVYAGGTFIAAGGGTGTQATRNRLAAFDLAGNLTTWNPGAGAEVRALVVDNGVLYAGGLFGTVGGGTGTTTSRLRLAAFDATGAVTAWNPGANNPVEVLEADGGLIYAGGSFTAVGGGTGTTTRNRLASFDDQGNVGSWGPTVGNTVYAMAIDSTRVYVGGLFTAPRTRLAAFDKASGSVTTWAASADSDVRALVVSGGTIYAGGNFTTVGSGATARNRLAAFDATGAVTTWNPNADSRVHALDARAGMIHATGEFQKLGVATRTRMAAIDASGNVLGQ